MGNPCSTEFSASHVGVLHRISNTVSSRLSVDEMLGDIVGMAVQTTACDACLVYLIDHASGEAVLRASQLPHVSDLGLLRMKSGEGVTGWVAQNRSVVALACNAGADPRFKRFQELVEDTYEAFLSVPLVSGGEVIGVINIHHRAPHQHSPEEIATVSFIGEQLGVAISRSILEEEKLRLLERTEEMEQELKARKLVERAKGILQRQNGVSEEEAYRRLRAQSRRLRRPMKDLAEAIILANEIAGKSEPQAAAG